MTSPLENLPGWNIAERMVRADDFDDMLRAAFKLQPRYTIPTAAIQLATDQSAWRDTMGEGGR